TVLGNLQVLFVAGLAWVLWKERPGRAVAYALPVVMIGVVLVSGLLDSSATGEHPLAGIFYGIGTSIAYAGYLLILRRSSSTSAPRCRCNAPGPSSPAAAPAPRACRRRRPVGTPRPPLIASRPPRSRPLRRAAPPMQ